MKIYEKSKKLDYVCYDIRGPIMDEADKLSAEGIDIVKLNIGNPAPFGFHAPEAVTRAIAENLTSTEGYSDSKGILAAREAFLLQKGMIKLLQRKEYAKCFNG